MDIGTLEDFEAAPTWRLLRKLEGSEQASAPWSPKKEPRIAQAMLFSLALVLGLLAAFAAGYHSKRIENDCVRLQSYWSPGLDAVRDFKTVRFNGSLGLPSPWTAEPSDEVDALWDHFVYRAPMSISDEEFGRLNVESKALVRFPPELGGGIWADLEMDHQLHCLDLLRKHTHLHYYESKDVSFVNQSNIIRVHLGKSLFFALLSREYDGTRLVNSEAEAEIVNHHTWIDHCINILRQNILCHADTTLLTYNWIKGYDSPYPNFNNWHVCRDWKAIDRWADSVALPKDKMMEWGMKKWDMNAEELDPPQSMLEQRRRNRVDECP
ncbi:hypothetical protein AYL99_10444 [Fonsecaea erecta]|uniref:Tat pathway signal sequence n=1 Tax=Fonsecaea erecta TaxID=1367422 RepID=A0A178Z7J8_9EURO|nr:hypothetical protein AYL99_10444 [Fonsecaea erecta]OAP55471.1 hypothetical protein AYL99_10444 [Fonsecaea erecta]